MNKLIESSVSCDNCSTNGTCHVVRIVLIGESLPGMLPSELYRLPYLKELDLSRNFLSGSIPAEWATMRLRDLHVMGNRLSGPFPKVLMNITTLRNLSIEGNSFSGAIISELGNLTNLEKLVLSANGFTGELPAILAKLTKLSDLRISSNSFSGKIPDFIREWTRMDKLHVQGCSFEGPIASTISELTNLTDLRISDINGGESPFPQLQNLTSLQTLILRNCSIYGSIPDYIWAMGSLRTLDLSFNSLTGKIPSFIANPEGLLFMYLTGNMLNGSIPGWILGSNNNLDVSHNNFILENSSQCPFTSVNLVESYSSTVDKISGFSSCLHNIPCLAPNKANHHSLYINCGGKEATINGSTKYEADIEVGGPSKLYTNQNWAFSSTGNFMDTEVGVENYIETNRSALSNISMFESELYTTARVSPLSLTYYGLCLMNGNYTVELHFAEIVFTNDNKFSSLGKRIFNVFIQGNVVLKDFNIVDETHGPGKSVVKTFTTIVTNHTLEIHFYWAGKGTTAIPSRGVYGPLISAISVHPNFDIPSSIGKAVIITLEVMGSVLFIILLVGGFLWRMGYLRSKVSMDEDLGSQHLKTGSFTLRQIKAATKNFDAANKIGEGGFGSVYKGLLSDGTVIAVKQLSTKSKQGSREFLNEIGFVSALQHPNLVKLFGCCIEGNQLMLVYEYMENNCLARALFGRDAQSRLKLDWPTRYKICLGLARGLTYLHEESRLKIVHRDIKASNVLLDKDLNAKISDFGLAKLHEEDQSHISTRLAGTIGYMAPEYAIRGYLTCKADVYSFGVVALEIVSGISNTNYRPKEEFIYLLDWANVLQGRGCLLELVDPNLGSNFSKEEAMVMLNVSLLCTNASSTLRPTMSTVVSMLEGREEVQLPLSGPDISSVQSSGTEATKNFWQVPNGSPGISAYTTSSGSSISDAHKEESNALL